MRVLYIIRGLPGSGKTTLAQRLCPKGYYFAADDYFTDYKGDYNFDPSKIGDAHEMCEAAVYAAMKTGNGPVAVHNTFSQPWEAAHYFKLAEELDYDVFVIECQNTFENTHNVPPQAIDGMRSRWLPLR